MDNNTIFPPVFYQSYMPAFVYTNTCRVYFSLSSYNSLSDLHHDSDIIDAVQVVVQNQITNQSMLKQSLYPSGIKLTTLQIDNNRQGDDKYYIEISPLDMQNEFELNQYYKIQIRFTAAEASNPPSSGAGIDEWLGSNLSYFSEWSKVVLIYCISMPNLDLNGFSTSGTNTFSTFEVPVIGKITFADSNDKELLKSYRIFLYQNDVLLQDSGDIIVNNNQNPNQINYYFKYNFQDNNNYTMSIQIVTNNLYSWSTPKTFNFSTEEQSQTPIDITISTEEDSAGGRIKVVLTSNYYNNDEINYIFDINNLITENSYSVFPSSTGSFIYTQDSTSLNNDDLDALYNNASDYNDLSVGTKLLIKRTSSKDLFNKWENIKNITIKQDAVRIIWFDYTIEPGVWYKYRIIRYNSSGVKTSASSIDTPFMIVTEDIFLNADGKQLKVRFDPQLNNYNLKVSEMLIETIGSKYPFVRRNGNINYRTFNISGTIASFMDIKENALQASKQDVYKSNTIKNLYQNYNEQNRIDLFNDYIYEREFRQKAMQFLCKDDVKLFRSLTEGNILIKLMNISFSPNNSLGRMIYSFSATAYQIDECNADNYNKYNIIKD